MCCWWGQRQQSSWTSIGDKCDAAKPVDCLAIVLAFILYETRESGIKEFCKYNEGEYRVQFAYGKWEYPTSCDAISMECGEKCGSDSRTVRTGAPTPAAGSCCWGRPCNDACDPDSHPQKSSRPLAGVSARGL